MIWDGDLPLLDILSSTKEGKPLPPLPWSRNNFLFTVTVSDVVSYHIQQNKVCDLLNATVTNAISLSFYRINKVSWLYEYSHVKNPTYWHLVNTNTVK